MRFTCSLLLAFVLATFGPVPLVAQFPTVRLATVPSPEETGLLRELLPDFERESGYRVVVYSGEDVHDVARAGKADLVISHYGHSGTEMFMAQGLGLWPRAVFANQIAFIGPAGDPAQIRGLQDAGAAFRQISGRSRFLSNNSAVMKYTENVLWEAAGRPPKGSWYVDAALSEADGMARAAEIKAYYIFALPPFLTWKQGCLDTSHHAVPGLPLLHPGAPTSSNEPEACHMDALLLAGTMPHRIMVSIVVNAQRVPAVNVSGATALQEYLLRPAVQARIERFRDPRSEYQLWKAAGLHNSAAGLGLGRRP